MQLFGLARMFRLWVEWTLCAQHWMEGNQVTLMSLGLELFLMLLLMDIDVFGNLRTPTKNRKHMNICTVSISSIEEIEIRTIQRRQY